MNLTDIARKYPGINILLTYDYRLVADSLNLIVLRRHVIDPTAAPNWAARVQAAEQAGEEPPDATVREEWREAAYFSVTADGLQCAVDYVVLQTVRRTDAGTVEALFDFIRKENGKVFAAISRKILGEIRDLSAG